MFDRFLFFVVILWVVCVLRVCLFAYVQFVLCCLSMICFMLFCFLLVCLVFVNGFLHCYVQSIMLFFCLCDCKYVLFHGLLDAYFLYFACCKNRKQKITQKQTQTTNQPDWTIQSKKNGNKKHLTKNKHK